MKLVLSILVALVFSTNIFSQKVYRFGQNAYFGVTNEFLDSTYKSAFSKDTSLSVIKNKKEFLDAYETMMVEFQSFLRNNNFTWEKLTVSYNRIYFDKTGKIDYFIFSFAPFQLTDGKQHEFGNLLFNFLQKYKFKFEGENNFEFSAPYKYQVLQ